MPHPAGPEEPTNKNRLKILEFVTVVMKLHPPDETFIVDLLSFIDPEPWDERDVRAFATLFCDYLKCLGTMGPAARSIGMSVSLAHAIFESPMETLREVNEGQTLMDLLLNIREVLPKNSVVYG